MLCFLLILEVIAQSAFADTWSTVYQTDFSTNPGWTTNNSSDFYWNSTAQTFYQSQKNGSGEYAYKLLPTSLQSNQEWRLEYDIQVHSDNNAANAGVALTDSNISQNAHPEMTLDFAQVDAGYYPFLEWHDNGGYNSTELPNSYSLGQWYHVLLQWDPTTSSLYGRVTNRDTGALLSELTATGVGTFSGIDRLAMTTVDHVYDSGRVATADIDNITVSQTPEPATLSLLALGGLLALRRRRSR